MLRNTRNQPNVAFNLTSQTFVRMTMKRNRWKDFKSLFVALLIIFFKVMSRKTHNQPAIALLLLNENKMKKEKKTWNPKILGIQQGLVWRQGVGDCRPAAGRCWFKDHYTMALYMCTRKSRFRREHGDERWGKGKRDRRGEEGPRFPGNRVVVLSASAWTLGDATLYILFT